MVWHHCYISLPYAAVYLTLWRTVVGFAPSQRRSKRFDSPTIRAPICRNPWQACLSAPAAVGGTLILHQHSKRAETRGKSRLARKSKRDSQGESLGRRRAREGGAAFSDSWREPPESIIAPAVVPCCNPSMPIHPASMPQSIFGRYTNDSPCSPLCMSHNGDSRIKGRFALETFYYQQRRYFAQNRMFNAYHDAVHCPCLIGKPPAAHLTETQITTVRGSRLATLHLYELRHCVRVNDTAYPPPVRSAHHTNLN